MNSKQKFHLLCIIILASLTSCLETIDSTGTYDEVVPELDCYSKIVEAILDTPYVEPEPRIIKHAGATPDTSWLEIDTFPAQILWQDLGSFINKNLPDFEDCKKTLKRSKKYRDQNCARLGEKTVVFKVREHNQHYPFKEGISSL